MKVVFALDSFKGTMTSEQACTAAQKGFCSVFPKAKTVIIPIADGGEGTAFAYYRAMGGEMVTAEVTSPQYGKTKAAYTILPDGTAVIEMAQASGITLVEGEKDGANATSYGTGELIAHALKKGCRRFIIGLGGSATNDGGCGALAALGVRFLTKDGQTIPLNGNGLSLLDKIDHSGIDPMVSEAEFIIACDVENTLCGKNGATYIYGPQKGVSENDLERLDNNLLRYAQKINQATGRDVLNIKGGGAAGGMCAGLLGFLNARTESGIKLLLEKVSFASVILDADIIFSGEGSVDKQTAFGKVISGIAGYTKSLNKPLIVVAGQLSDGYENIYDSGVTAAFGTIPKLQTFEDIKKNAEENLFKTVANIAKLLNINNKM